MSSNEFMKIRELLKEFDQDPRYNLFETKEAEQVYIKNTIAEENLDFDEEEISHSKTELLKYLNAERILG